MCGLRCNKMLHLISNIRDEQGRRTVVIYVPCVYFGTFQFNISLWYPGNVSCFLHFIERRKGIVGGCSSELNLLVSLTFAGFPFTSIYLFRECLINVYVFLSFSFPLALLHFLSHLNYYRSFLDSFSASRAYSF